MVKMRLSYIIYNDLKEIGKLQPEGWPDIVPEFAFYIRKKFCFPVKAIIGHRIVGVGTLIVFGKTCWLAHIIVDQNFRNRGIGFQITEKLIHQGNKRSVSTFLLIATELGLPLYQKAGFRLQTKYQYFQRSNPWRDYPLCPNIFSYENPHGSEIYEMDIKISGEDRRTLLADYMTNTLVYKEGNSLTGFYIPDLGEGIILASTTEAGLELMKVKYSKIHKAVLPMDNQAGIDFLKQNGFTLSKTQGTRMILGKDIDWKPKSVFSRIGGNYG